MGNRGIDICEPHRIAKTAVALPIAETPNRFQAERVRTLQIHQAVVNKHGILRFDAESTACLQEHQRIRLRTQSR